ncbi:MAG: hypothetical protein ACOC3Z_00310 [Nanoarchaeota archaeon]
MCKKCETDPVYEFTNKKKLCKICFIKWFEKKFLYTIRKFEMIKKQDIIGYYKKDDYKRIVLEELLKMFTQKSEIKIINLLKNPKSKITKIATPETTDKEAKKIIKIIITNKSKKLENELPINKKNIKPLYLFLEKEIFLYAKLKNFNFKKIKSKENEKISNLINKLEKKHPEVKRAIINSLLKIEKNNSNY